MSLHITHVTFVAQCIKHIHDNITKSSGARDIFKQSFGNRADQGLRAAVRAQGHFGISSVLEIGSRFDSVSLPSHEYSG